MYVGVALEEEKRRPWLLPDAEARLAGLRVGAVSVDFFHRSL
jgi:hypothetical protein